MRKIYTLLHIVCFFFIQTNTAQTEYRLTPVIQNFKSITIKSSRLPLHMSLLAFTVLLASLGIHQSQSRNRKKLSWLCDPERKLLDHLLQHRDQNITTIDLNELLNCAKKSQESQRRIRHLVINRINFHLEFRFKIKNAIERSPSEEDKRMFNYHLKPGIEDQIKSLLHP